MKILGRTAVKVKPAKKPIQASVHMRYRGSTSMTIFTPLRETPCGPMASSRSTNRCSAAARGDFTVAPDRAVAGTVRVELGGSRIQTMTLRIRGDERFMTDTIRLMPGHQAQR